jgi:hypothetical protein
VHIAFQDGIAGKGRPEFDDWLRFILGSLRPYVRAMSLKQRHEGKSK